MNNLETTIAVVIFSVFVGIVYKMVTRKKTNTSGGSGGGGSTSSSNAPKVK